MASEVGDEDAAYSLSLAKWLRRVLSGFPDAEAAEQGVAGGKLSPRAGLHPDQTLLRLEFPRPFPQG